MPNSAYRPGPAAGLSFCSSCSCTAWTIKWRQHGKNRSLRPLKATAHRDRPLRRAANRLPDVQSLASLNGRMVPSFCGRHCRVASTQGCQSGNTRVKKKSPAPVAGLSLTYRSPVNVFARCRRSEERSSVPKLRQCSRTTGLWGRRWKVTTSPSNFTKTVTPDFLTA